MVGSIWEEGWLFGSRKEGREQRVGNGREESGSKVAIRKEISRGMRERKINVGGE